jgi:hypothetical protein
MAITVSDFIEKTFLRSVDPKQPSHFHFVSQGEVHDLSGEVQNDLRGVAHLSTPRSKSGLDANKSPQLERAY